MRLRDRIEYSAIVDRPPLTLPEGGRVVVWPIVTVEVWDDESAQPRTVLSPPTGKTFLPDVPNWTWAEYGMRVGFWRIKAVLDALGVVPTLSLNGAVIETYPRIAQAALEAGWEFMAHSYIQKPMHALDDEHDAIRRTVAAIREFTGKPPRGWMGPGLTETKETPDLLTAEGIEYVADWVLDDQPCELKTRSGVLYTIPYSVEINDVVVSALQTHRSDELYRRAMDQFECLYAEGKESARVMAVAVHPYLHGVPHRIKYFKKIFEDLRGKPGVLFWTGERIIDWYKSQRRS